MILAIYLLVIATLLHSPSSVATSQLPNTTALKIDHEELDYLCHHYYKDEFVIASDILEGGCRLECVLLQASGAHGSNFFDATTVKTHVLNEGYECGPRQICSNGSCVASNEPETGHAYITIASAKLPDKDRKSEGPKSDAFVKIFLDDNYLMKTKVIDEDNEPQWRETFVTPLITSDTSINLLIFDKDDNREELITGSKVVPRDVVAEGKNSTLTCVSDKAPLEFCYGITWIPKLF